METLKQYITKLAHQNKMVVYDRSVDSEKELRNLKANNLLKNTKLPVIMMSFEQKKQLRITIDNTGTGDGFGLTFSYNAKIRPQILLDILAYTGKYRVITRTEYSDDGYPVVGHLVTDCQ